MIDYYRIPEDVLVGDWPPEWVRLRLSIDTTTHSSFFLHSNIGLLDKSGFFRGFYADIGDCIIRISGHGLESIYPNGLYLLLKKEDIKHEDC